jgi:hypothetical protein
MAQLCYRHHRFPPEIIKHPIWQYLRFTLSYRDVEDLLAEEGSTSPAKRCSAGAEIAATSTRWWSGSPASGCISSAPGGDRISEAALRRGVAALDNRTFGGLMQHLACEISSIGKIGFATWVAARGVAPRADALIVGQFCRTLPAATHVGGVRKRALPSLRGQATFDTICPSWRGNPV